MDAYNTPARDQNVASAINLTSPRHSSQQEFFATSAPPPAQPEHSKNPGHRMSFWTPNAALNPSYPNQGSIPLNPNQCSVPLYPNRGSVPLLSFAQRPMTSSSPRPPNFRSSVQHVPPPRSFISGSFSQQDPQQESQLNSSQDAPFQCRSQGLYGSMPLYPAGGQRRWSVAGDPSNQMKRDNPSVPLLPPWNSARSTHGSPMNMPYRSQSPGGRLEWSTPPIRRPLSSSPAPGYSGFEFSSQDTNSSIGGPATAPGYSARRTPIPTSHRPPRVPMSSGRRLVDAMTKLNRERSNASRLLDEAKVPETPLAEKPEGGMFDSLKKKLSPLSQLLNFRSPTPHSQSPKTSGSSSDRSRRRRQSERSGSSQLADGSGSSQSHSRPSTSRPSTSVSPSRSASLEEASRSRVASLEEASRVSSAEARWEREIVKSQYLSESTILEQRTAIRNEATTEEDFFKSIEVEFDSDSLQTDPIEESSGTLSSAENTFGTNSSIPSLSQLKLSESTQSAKLDASSQRKRKFSKSGMNAVPVYLSSSPSKSLLTAESFNFHPGAQRTSQDKRTSQDDRIDLFVSSLSASQASSLPGHTVAESDVANKSQSEDNTETETNESDIITMESIRNQNLGQSDVGQSDLGQKATTLQDLSLLNWRLQDFNRNDFQAKDDLKMGDEDFTTTKNDCHAESENELPVLLGRRSLPIESPISKRSSLDISRESEIEFQPLKSSRLRTVDFSKAEESERFNSKLSPSSSIQPREARMQKTACRAHFCVLPLLPLPPVDVCKRGTQTVVSSSVLDSMKSDWGAKEAHWDAKQADWEAMQADWEGKQADWEAKEDDWRAKESEWALKCNSLDREAEASNITINKLNRNIKTLDSNVLNNLRRATKAEEALFDLNASLPQKPTLKRITTCVVQLNSQPSRSVCLYIQTDSTQCLDASMQTESQEPLLRCRLPNRELTSREEAESPTMHVNSATASDISSFRIQVPVEGIPPPFTLLERSTQHEESLHENSASVCGPRTSSASAARRTPLKREDVLISRVSSGLRNPSPCNDQTVNRKTASRVSNNSFSGGSRLGRSQSECIPSPQHVSEDANLRVSKRRSMAYSSQPIDENCSGDSSPVRCYSRASVDGHFSGNFQNPTAASTARALETKRNRVAQSQSGSSQRKVKPTPPRPSDKRE